MFIVLIICVFILLIIVYLDFKSRNNPKEECNMSNKCCFYNICDKQKPDKYCFKSTSSWYKYNKGVNK